MGAGSTGAAAVGGSSAGSASSSDRVYRISMRMDDGNTQVVTQETTPDFRSGDRVNLSGGVIQH
jgi:outer membrane lipoprotein SlyB